MVPYEILCASRAVHSESARVEDDSMGKLLLHRFRKTVSRVVDHYNSKSSAIAGIPRLI
jgi:hypothetical protein